VMERRREWERERGREGWMIHRLTMA
jgi:hypothetical protein